MSNYMLNLYIKYFDKKELCEKEKGKSFTEFENELKERLNNLTIDKLIDLYINYSRVSFIMINYKPIESLLDLIYDNISSRLNTLSVSELINLVTVVSEQILSVNANINSNTNIINVRTSNLANDFFISNETRKKNVNKDKFIADYKKEIEDYISNLEYCHASSYFLNRISSLLDFQVIEQIDNLTVEEEDNLLVTLNSKIEEISNLILKVNGLFTSRTAMELEAKFGVDTLLDLVTGSKLENLKNNLELYNKYVSLIGKDNVKKN